ncbi:MAG: hypothetical protein ACYCW6_10660 [Candidatus Xenobia bacterium]
MEIALWLGCGVSLAERSPAWGRCSVTVYAEGWRGRLNEYLYVRACPYYIKIHGEDFYYHNYDSFEGEFLNASSTFDNVPVPPDGVAHYRIEIVWLCHFTRRRIDPNHDHDDDSDAVRHDERVWDQADASELNVRAGDQGQSFRKTLWTYGIDIPGDVYP